MICSLCPRRCGARRERDYGEGYCGMGTEPVVARAALHHWEEPCISGSRGSGTVFFSGCTLGCVFCQNYEISAKRFGKKISVRRLADIFRELESQGAHNINLVNPTHFVPAIAEAFSLYRPGIPVVYNSSGYESRQTLSMMNGLVDIYLPDLKYIESGVSEKYSHAPDYFFHASQAVGEMLRQTGSPVYDENGMMTRGTLVRHLILHQNTKNSILVLRWLAEHYPHAPVSLMAQYLPMGRAQEYPEINRIITKREYEKVLAALFDSGLDGFVQERASAKKDFVPSFLLEGVEENKKEGKEEVK